MCPYTKTKGIESLSRPPDTFLPDEYGCAAACSFAPTHATWEVEE